MVKDFVDFYGKNIVNESTLVKGVKNFLIWLVIIGLIVILSKFLSI